LPLDFWTDFGLIPADALNLERILLTPLGERLGKKWVFAL
jgi:hypothetical protein